MSDKVIGSPLNSLLKDERFMEWAKMPMSEEEIIMLGRGMNTPVMTYDELLEKYPVDKDELKQVGDSINAMLAMFDKDDE